MTDRQFGEIAAFLPVRTSETHHPLQENTLSEEVPMLLLMAGFAGAGKTTLAEWLISKLNKSEPSNWKILSKDHLKLNHLLLGEELRQAGWNAFEDLFKSLKEVLVQGKSVIIDTSNEHPFVLENILNVVQQLEQYHIRPYLKVILCVANKETRTRRLQERGSEFEPFEKDLPDIVDDAEFEERFKHLLEGFSLPEHFNHASNHISIVDIQKGLAINTTPPVDVYGKFILERLNLSQSK